MVTPLNKNLQELRMSLEHYQRVLKNDKELKEKGNPDNCRLLTSENIEDINLKIEGINSKINELLIADKDYEW